MDEEQVDCDENGESASGWRHWMALCGSGAGGEKKRPQVVGSWGARGALVGCGYDSTNVLVVSRKAREEDLQIPT